MKKVSMLIVALLAAVLTGCTQTVTAKPVMPKPATAVQVPSAGQDAMVQTFYDWYLQTAKEKSPLVSGAYKESPYLSDSFKRSLEQRLKGELGADPILCAQSVPSKATAAPVDLKSSQWPVVKVTLPWGGNKETQVEVLLAQNGGTWQVDGVRCPAP